MRSIMCTLGVEMCGAKKLDLWHAGSCSPHRTLFIVLYMDTCINLAEPFRWRPSYVSVRVPPLTTVPSTDVVDNALLPSTRLGTVRCRTPLATVVDVTF